MDFNSLLHAHTKLLVERATATTTVRNRDDQNSPPPAYSSLPTQQQQASTDDDDDDDDHHLYADADAEAGVRSSSPSEEEADDDDEPSTLAIDATTSIHGSNNIIAVPPVDGPRLTAILLSLLNGHMPPCQHQHHQRPAQQPPQPQLYAALPQMQAQQPQRPALLHGRRLHLNVKCGVHVVGNHNMLGVGPRIANGVPGARITAATPAARPASVPEGAAQVKVEGGAAKRKCEDASAPDPRHPFLKPLLANGGKQDPDDAPAAKRADVDS